MTRYNNFRKGDISMFKLLFIISLVVPLTFFDIGGTHSTIMKTENVTQINNVYDSRFMSNKSIKEAESNLKLAYPAPPNDETVYFTQYELAARLQSEFTESSIWSKNDALSKCVIDDYGGEPINHNEETENDPLKLAKESLGITDFLGCGIMALYSQLEYFANYRGYYWLNRSDSGQSDESVELAKEIINTSRRFPFGSNGTFIFPSDLVTSFNSVLATRGYQYPSINAHVQYNFQINPEGSKNMIKESIDNGMPIIWFVQDSNARGIPGHYMNLIGYNTYIGTNSLGESVEKIVYEIVLNWNGFGERHYYVTENALNYFNGGVMFEYSVNHSHLKTNDFNFRNQYYFDEKTDYLTTNDTDGTIVETRLRTGGLIENNWLVMSAKRENAGMAFLKLHFPYKVRHIYFFASLWSYNEFSNAEFADPNKANFYVEAGNSSNSLNKVFEKAPILLTTNKDKPMIYCINLDVDSYYVKFNIMCSNPTGDRNKGRVCLSNMLFLGGTQIA